MHSAAVVFLTPGLGKRRAAPSSRTTQIKAIVCNDEYDEHRNAARKRKKRKYSKQGIDK